MTDTYQHIGFILNPEGIFKLIEGLEKCCLLAAKRTFAARS
jgi:hypothetical protein